MISEVLRPGHDVLIDDGRVRLVVEHVDAGRAICRVLVGGEVTSNKGVNLPGVPIPIPSLTEKDLEDLEFALELEVDFVALSFVRAAADVRELKEIIRKRGSARAGDRQDREGRGRRRARRHPAEADGVMVARGDLGIEMGVATVPLMQKRIILRCLETGKPVITATQMLESMIEHAEPTRAEASDVANAILDGTSAVMLSAETAVGAYPVEAVRTMDRIARAIEPSMDYRHQLPGDEHRRAARDGERGVRPGRDAGREGDPRPELHGQDGLGRRAAAAPLADRRALARADRGAADGARMGRHAAALSRHRRTSRISGCGRSRRRATAGTVKPGDLVVLIAGTAVNMPGSTNVIKVDIA